MNRYLTKLCIFYISLLVFIGFVESSPGNGTSTDENRNPRVSGRIVKLYSGYKSEPITCTEEGFRADPADCSIFYRCVGAKSGKFSVLRFQCGPGTVFDPDNEVCNHPHSTKRSGCGSNRPFQFLISPVDQVNENDIDSSAHELPSPITSKKPLDVDQTSAWYRPNIVPGSSEHQSMTPLGYVTFTPDVTEPKELSTSKTSIASTPYPWSTSISSINHTKITTTHSRGQDESLNECHHDGFMGDKKDCRKFYRCVNNQRGGFTKYEFTCSESTIWDDDMQSCNHPWAVRRSACARDVRGTENSNSDNDSKFHPNKNISAENLINRTTETLSYTTQTYYGNRINVDKANAVLNPNNLNIPSNAYLIENDYVTSKIQYNLTPPTSSYLGPLIQTQKQLYESTTKTSTYAFGTNDTSHSTRNPSNKAINIKCTESGFMGDPNDCRKFYRCVKNGKDSYIKHEFLCGEGTAWDKRAESCNHAWMVKECSGKLLQDVLSTNKSDIEVKQTTSYPNIISGENGYNIGGSQSREPNALPVTTGMLLSPPVGGEYREVCNSVGYRGSKTDCRKFYRCVENDNGGFTKLDYICDEGTLWDSNIEACNHAAVIKNCGVNANNASKFSTSSTESSIITTISLIQSTIQSSNIGYNDEVKDVSYYKESTPNVVLPTTDNKCQESGFMADRNDCRKFFRCVEKENNTFIRFEYSCGDGTAWDARINACNHLRAVPTCGNDYYSEPTSSKLPAYETDENGSSYKTQVDKNGVSTVRTESTPEANVDHTTKPTLNNHKLNVCTRSGFFGDISDCKKFYRCVSNNDGSYTRHEFSCGEGTVWDHELEACNHAASVNRCGGTPEAQNDVMTVPPQPLTTMNSVNDELDIGYTQNFDGSNSAALPSSSDYPPDFNNNQECNEVGLMGDKNDCKKFYRCVENGQGGFIRFEFSCGDGTAWDPSIEACNHISSVKECASISNDFLSSTSKSPQSANPTHSTVASYPQHDDAQVTPKPIEENADCASEGFYGNKRDCKKFYRCVSNQQGGFIKYEFSCGDGAIWDPNIQGCNHETSDNMNCTILSTTDSKPESAIKPANNQETQDNPAVNEISTTEKSVDSPSNNTCSSEGFYPNLEDCKKFIRCVNNGDGKYVRYDFTCGEGTIWVQDIQACDHENDNSTCSSGILTSSEAYIVTTQSTQTEMSSTIQNVVTSGNIVSTEYPESSVSKIDECHSEGYYANSNDCRRFYRCVADGHGMFVKYEYICGEGTAWDLDTQSCNHIGSIKRCTGVQDSQTTTLVTNVEQSQTTEIIKTTIPPTTSALKPQTTESIKTTTILTTRITQPQTTENIKTTMEPTTKIAQPQTTENIYKTTIQQTSTPVVTPMQEDPSTTENCHAEGYYGNKENCQKFYRCVNNGQGSYIKYDYICGEGTMWDQDILACNHPQDVKNPSCKEDSNTSTTSVSTESSVQPTDSTSLSSQTPTYTTSKQTTVSSSEGSSQGTSNCSSENIKNENMACTKAGYYPNPENCKKFYRCVDWDGDGQRFSIFHFECGDGTIWDPALDTCNYEESVYPPRNCKGLQIQNGNTSSTSAVSTEENTTSYMSSETTTQTTQQITSTESTSQQITSTESTTQQITSTESTTQQISSTESTTQQVTSTESSTQQITSTESTTQQVASTESTTQQISSTESTTQQITSTYSTTQQQMSTDTTTTQSTTITTEQSTAQQTTLTTETTTTDQTTSVATSTTTEQPTTTEKTTTESTTITEQPTSTATEQSSTEQSTTETSQLSSTGQSTTTEETTSTTVQQSTELSTESSSSTTTENGINTSTTESTPETSTESSSPNKCPETEKDQYLYACPTSFKRHPKYCNLFYQCLEDNDTHELKIAVFNCPNGTIYDESKIQCVEERNAQNKCEGSIAQKRRFKRLNINTKETITASKNTYRCPRVGHFPFEKNEECSPAFLRCDLSTSGKLRGFVYRCPENYVYWPISRKCEPVSKMPHCKHSISQWTKRHEIPIERKNVAH